MGARRCELDERAHVADELRRPQRLEVVEDDDEFFDALRGDARSLRYEGTAASLERIRAGVQARIAREEGIAVILLGWFRPVVLGLAAATIAAVTIVGWFQQPAVSDLLASSDVATLSEDSYRAAE